ncbi:protein of unknown function [Rhodovastum atsumiense]|nr:protein of unknown function [Rhodovastum atsumiense]
MALNTIRGELMVAQLVARHGDISRRREMIEPKHPRLSMVQPCALVSISRSAYCGGGRVRVSRIWS